MPVWGSYGLYGKVKGDKIIIHKCDLDKAVKHLKDTVDPYGDEYVAGLEGGRMDLIRELLHMIRRGNKELKEKYKR